MQKTNLDVCSPPLWVTYQGANFGNNFLKIKHNVVTSPMIGLR